MIRISSDADGAFTLFDGDKPCGSARAAFGEELTLLSVDAPDAVLGEGLVRAVLNAGRARGIARAVCDNAALFPLLDKLTFAVTPAGRAVDIAAFFSRGCPSRAR